MRDTKDILKHAAEYAGFRRARFNDSAVPASMSQVSAFVLFADFRSMPLAASTLMKRYREEAKGSKYTVLCSWPGYQGLFPYFDEYWEVSPERMKLMFNKSLRFGNPMPEAVEYVRKLNYFFEEVGSEDELKCYHFDGFTSEFFQRFGTLKIYKPLIQSAAILGQDFMREMNARPGNKVFLYPGKYASVWRKRSPAHILTQYDFWVDLAEQLIESGYVPVVYRDFFCHDISRSLAQKCFYLSNLDVSGMMAAMRACGCVLDVFTGVSRLANLARTPYVACDERHRYFNTKEFEFDYLGTPKNLPLEYIFSFSTIIESGGPSAWNNGLIESILARLNKLYSGYNRDSLPATSEIEEITSYSEVSRLKSKRLGARFVRIPRL